MPFGRSVSTVNEVACGACRLDLGTRRQLFGFEGAEQRLDLGQGGLGIDIAHHHENGVVGRVPGVMKFLEIGRGGLLERRPRAERIVRIRRVGKHGLADFRVQDVTRVGQVLCHFLLDGAALLFPAIGGLQHGLHPDRLDMQRYVEIFGRYGEQVLGQAFTRIGVEVAAHHIADVGELLGRQSRAAAEHHVLHGVRGPGKTGRCLDGAGQIIDRGRDHGCEGVPHDDHAQPVARAWHGAPNRLPRRASPLRSSKPKNSTQIDLSSFAFVYLIAPVQPRSTPRGSNC